MSDVRRTSEHTRDPTAKRAADGPTRVATLRMVDPGTLGMWPAFCVRAPALELTKELRWVLVRAFSASHTNAPVGIDAARVLSLSRELDLAERIAVRHAATLPDEIGPEIARRLTFHRLEAVALDRVLWSVTTHVSAVAAQLGVPIVLLKHAALRRSGLVQEGARHARDLDVLAPDSLASHLQDSLVAVGFRSGGQAPLFHLPPLTKDPGEVVEIHKALWGVRLPGAGGAWLDATASVLLTSGLIQSLSDRSLVPSNSILAAHAIVHGLVQHRSSPTSYPAMRVLADLDAIESADAGVEAGCQSYIEHIAHPELIRAAFGLTHALRSGLDPHAIDRASPEFELLSHLVASSTDSQYRRALRFERVSEFGGVRGLGRAMSNALSSSLPDEGNPAEPERLHQRAARPLSLFLEFTRGAGSYVSLRFRRR